MTGNVNHPKHYADTTSFECIDVMGIIFGIEQVVSFCLCNAFKYVWRYKNKNGIEDIEKAKWYLNKATELGASYKQTDFIENMRNYISKIEAHYAQK